MKRQPINTKCRTSGPKATLTLLATTFALGATLALNARADMYLPEAAPGGIQVSPVITSIATNGSNVTVSFDGLQAPYMIQVSSNSVDWENGGITKVKHPNFSGSALVTNVPEGSAFFRLMMLGSESWVGKYNPGALAVSNVFVGWNKCNGCHGDKVTQWLGTDHANAISRILDTNSGALLPGRQEFCITCHSVGHTQPGGFVSLTNNTAHLANVQCESCHGSANAHINISGRQYHPVATLAAETCGGCHNGDHHPTYDEWSDSLHKPQLSTTVTSPGRQAQCAACHSTATRMAMLKNYEDMQNGITNFLALPSMADATNSTAACVVCHDPHSTNQWTAQLRNPLSSTNFYTYGTTTASTNLYYTNSLGQITTNTHYLNTPFASQYDPNVQICGQCHNTRGAQWTDTSRPPHHSPQYNMLIGTLQEGYLSTNLTSRHGRLDEACVTCHVVNYAPGFTNGTIAVVEGGVTNMVPNITTNYNTGHSFEVNYNGCALAGCHVSNGAEGIKEETEHEQDLRKATLAKVVAKLNYWATNVAPTIDPAFAPFGTLAWEYDNAGQLSTTTGQRGPGSGLQAKIPAEIKQARFNLYMFEHDGSYGIHNRQLTPLLFNDAEAKVDAVTYPLANFSGTPAVGYAPLTVAFKNLGAGSSYSWTFGDGNVSASANPTNVYAARGLYTVSCTADGTQTQTRADYINVVIRPTVNFAADQTTVVVGTPITFTNTSANVIDVTSWRWQFNTSDSSTRVTTSGTENQTWTYTAPGTYSVSLRATTPAGNSGLTTTKTGYITVTAAP